ncbi:MAG: hypothetical protein J7K01_02580 [Thermovirga sp.]|nr:hypothetical protein [Thermovirga sp.]
MDQEGSGIRKALPEDNGTTWPESGSLQEEQHRNLTRHEGKQSPPARAASLTWSPAGHRISR